MNKEYSFEWDTEKEKINFCKHGIDFATAAEAFLDPERKIFIDQRHSRAEERYFCLGRVSTRILTVRFTYRRDKIRIIGAGFWRGAKKYYEE